MSDLQPDGSAVIRKIYRRLIPFLCLLFIVNYLDRTNVAMAALKMQADAGLSDEAYGFGAGLFFVGYFLFEAPSNLILHRVGARRWIARIMISWGFLSAALMLTQGPRSFYVLRLLLGVAEAGFFPGIVFYLTAWVPASRRAGVLAAFLTSTATSGLIGTPLAGTLMQMEGIGGLHGWQWLFLLEGLPAVVLGVAILVTGLLPNRPAEANWVERPWAYSGPWGRSGRCRRDISAVAPPRRGSRSSTPRARSPDSSLQRSSAGRSSVQDCSQRDCSSWRRRWQSGPCWFYRSPEAPMFDGPPRASDPALPIN
jgi:MFS family permease